MLTNLKTSGEAELYDKKVEGEEAIGSSFEVTASKVINEKTKKGSCAKDAYDFDEL